eukprot:422001-Prymnesium_polylepis.1
MLSQYELDRLDNIARNQAVLQALGLDNSLTGKSKEKPKARKQPEKQKSGRPPPSAGTRAAKAAKSGKQGGIRISVSEVTDQGEIVTPDDAMVSMKKRKQPSREVLCFKCKCVLDNERG